jgi:ribosomal protein S18 acetylase RimI-like enzyme
MTSATLFSFDRCRCRGFRPVSSGLWRRERHRQKIAYPLLGQGLRVAHRWGRVFEALHALRSPEPLWYLGTLGVDPPCQGRGFGSALVTAWLEEVDRDSRPACLETDTRENVGFYARAGFCVEEELSLLDTPVWRMRRPGRVCENETGTDSQ